MTVDACLPDAGPADRPVRIVAPRGPHRLPARCPDPPYDDELPAGRGASGALALAIEPVARPAGPPRVSTGPAHLVAGHRTVPAAGRDGQFHHAPGSAAVVVVRAIVETLSGIRAPSQLAGWTTPRLQADLERRTPREGARPRCSVRSIRVSEPRPGVAEVSAVIVRGTRAAALALRMESTDGRWRVTTLQVG